MNTLTPSASAQRTFDITWCLTVMAGVLLAYTLVPDMAMATTTASGIDKALCNVYNAFTGTTGRVLASIAIIIVGIGALMGKISWGMALIVAIGVALVFGAASIVDIIGKNVNTNATSGAGSATFC